METIKLKVQKKHPASRKMFAKGFTLIELLVVIVIIGVIALIVNNVIGGSGISDQAKATQKYDAAAKIANSWATVAQFMNVSKSPTDSNLFANTAHDALDVLIPTDPSLAIDTNLRAKYQASSPIRALEQFQVLTEPTATARGEYAIGNANNVVTVTYNTATQVMTVNIAAVSAEETRALIDTYFPSNTGTNYTTTARTTSNIQYTAISANNTHDIKFIRKI